MVRIAYFICCLSVVIASADGFSFEGIAKGRRGAVYDTVGSPDGPPMQIEKGRRSFLSQMVAVPVITTAVATTTLLSPLSPRPANASGGATAGGAYLLSAKQRYNERVKASVQGLLSAADGLKSGDSKAAKTYFESEEGGSYKDLTAAGYLLSNAFRRNSTAAPDSLPSVKVRCRTINDTARAPQSIPCRYASVPSFYFLFVDSSQKYKAFAAEIANLQKALKKKGAAAASDEFPKVEAALNEWLTEIELPIAREL